MRFEQIASLYLVNVEINFRRRLKFPFKSVGSFGPHKISLFVLWKGKKMLSFHQGFRQTPATAGNQQSEWPLLPVFLPIRDNGAGTGERTLHEAYESIRSFRLSSLTRNYRILYHNGGLLVAQPLQQTSAQLSNYSAQIDFYFTLKHSNSVLN